MKTTTLSPASSKWTWIGKKADAAGAVWSMWECQTENLVKRTTLSNHGENFHVTLYWRRGAFDASGRPLWYPTLRQLRDAEQRAESVV